MRGAPTRKVLVLSHGVNNANPSFCAGKKIRKREAFSWFPNLLLLLKAALSRLDFGPAYYEDPVSRTLSFPFLGSRGSYAAAFPGLFLLVLRPEAILDASSVDKMAALQLTQEWDGSGPPASSF